MLILVGQMPHSTVPGWRIEPRRGSFVIRRGGPCTAEGGRKIAAHVHAHPGASPAQKGPFVVLCETTTTETLSARAIAVYSRLNMTEFQVSLLRGINVGGHNRISMPRLRETYERLGCCEVTTYVQSGNVIFASPDDPAVISTRAELGLESEMGSRIHVLGRTHKDLSRIVAEDPYPDAEPAQHHVVFLSGPARPDGIASIAAAALNGEALVARDGEIHLLLPNGLGPSRIPPALTERILGVVPTTRNWRTVRTLSELSRPRP